MRILIIGGFGFVGGRLAEYLEQAGHQIVLGTRNAITHCAWLPKAEVAQIEWGDATALEHSCNGVDVVIHAAGMNAQDCAADPVAALVFNGAATGRLVAAASQAGVQRFIYLSTAHVYASQLVGTITEKTCPLNLHPYATSHLAGEQAVLCANQRGQIQGSVLRLSNAFGAPMHKDVNCWMLLVNDLCRQAVQTRKLALQSTGLQHRDFIGLTEVCRVAAFLVVGNGSYRQTGVFNIGTGVSQSVLSMAQSIKQRCKEVLGINPALHRMEDGSSEQSQTLSYRSDNLAALGISLKCLDNTAEIDNLLHFCQATFVPTESSRA